MWIEIIKFLVSLIDKRSHITIEKKEKLSKALERMAELIDFTIEDLEHDIYPSGKCIAMEQLSNDILLIVKDYMPKEDVDDLSRQLFIASRLELEFATRKNKSTITELQKASGKLHAFSIIYSV